MATARCKAGPLRPRSQVQQQDPVGAVGLGVVGGQRDRGGSARGLLPATAPARHARARRNRASSRPSCGAPAIPSAVLKKYRRREKHRIMLCQIWRDSQRSLFVLRLGDTDDAMSTPTVAAQRALSPSSLIRSRCRYPLPRTQCRRLTVRSGRSHMVAGNHIPGPVMDWPVACW